MRAVIIGPCLALALGGNALAADSPPPPKPTVTLTEDNLVWLRAYIGKLPYDEAAPLVAFFAQKQAEAAQAKPAKP